MLWFFLWVIWVFPRGEGTADGLAKLADLEYRGALTQEEYERAKTQLLTSAGKS